MTLSQNLCLSLLWLAALALFLLPVYGVIHGL